MNLSKLTTAQFHTIVGLLEKKEALQALITEINQRYLPERRLILKIPADPAKIEALAPAARDYPPVEAGPVVYLCHHFTCQPPTGDPGELAAKLDEIKPSAV